VTSFDWLTCTQEAFEKKFLSATEKLYAAEGNRLVNELDVPAYLAHCEKRLKVTYRHLLKEEVLWIRIR
jgi:cullin-4